MSQVDRGSPPSGSGPVGGVERGLLESWPDRFRFPDVLVALVRPPARDGEAYDSAVIARAVLAHVGGRPPRAVCEELLERGEFDVAEYALRDCPDLDGHEKQSLGRKLEAARVAACEGVRQRVTALERRAAAAGLAFDPPDADTLDALARSRADDADAALDTVAEELDERAAPIVEKLEEQLVRQTADPAARNGRHIVQRVKALLAAGELVVAGSLLNREPLGVPIPEGVTPLPPWNEEWSPETFLAYHLEPTKPRPPEFVSWAAADSQGTTLLATYDRLARDPSPGAAEAFADALSRFLGAPGGGTMAQEVRESPFHLAFFDGLFGTEGLSRLHPTGRIDLYVGGPGTTVVPDQAEGQAPHLAVGPGLEAPAYTDRRATAVLSLCDLLRLVVLPHDRAAAVLGIIARQWPVTALTGASAPALAGILGTEPDAAWRTLRWITHLSLGGGLTAVQAMENCTGMDPALLRVMLGYAEHRAETASPTGLWDAATGGWQRDEALVHALREDIVTRCGDPAAEAAWWAALAVCDAGSGRADLEDIGVQAEICSTWERAGAEVLGGVDTLVAGGLLRRDAESTSGVHGADGTDSGNGTDSVIVPLSGVVRALRASAEEQLTVLLERLEHARGELPAHPVTAPGDDTVPAGWTAWHRNRFATVPAHARYAEAEALGAGSDARASIAAEAAAELLAQTPDDLATASPRPCAEVAQVLRLIGAQCEEQYPQVRLDLRCPPGTWVGVPEPVLRAVLYEVLDNAAEALAAEGGGLIQVSATSESPEVLVEVQDNGPGLPAEAHQGRRIFLPDWTSRGEGRGNGLYRVRRFLRAFATPSVETDAAVFASAHPTLTGASLRLILPEHPAPKE
ncbi:ATP-binding protein [Streptomyces sp. NPDC059452]|uniref:ATP-binding protein n=1 Tax=Streptomyces sp. NPDC059452 TaxID=3346835 RepID=UPI003674F0DF